MLHNIKQIRKITSKEPEYVYDIEMRQNPHNFFANDILVHNSLFVHYGDHDPDILVKAAKQFKEHYRNEVLSIHNKDLQQSYYIMQLELQKLLSHIYFGESKKRYYGIQPNGKIYTHGLNIIGKQCPMFLRGKLKSLFEKVVKQTITIDDITDLRYQVQNSPLIQIGVFKRFGMAFDNYVKVKPQILKGAL